MKTKLNYQLYDLSGAEFSDCGKYRYKLWRIWDPQASIVTFIGLNPSTANEVDNDATIRRVIRYAKDWGYGGVYMMNLFAYISTQPAKLLTSGEDLEINNKHLDEVVGKSSMVVFAWGAFKQAKLRSADIIKKFPFAHCLAKNKDGSPVHPLFQKADLEPVFFDENYGR